MDERKYNIKDLTLAYFQKKSKIYRTKGFRYAKFLGRRLEDYEDHFFAFLIDINVCLLPVYLWVVEFLLILCGLIPPHFFDLLFYVMFALLFVVSVLALGIFTSRSRGQSFGAVMMDLKLVRGSKKEASSLNLIMRQALGFGVPFMVLGYFFQIFGVIAWWVLNGIVVMITPNQQTIMDLIFGLRFVREPEVNIQFSNDVNKQEKVCPIDLHICSNYSQDGYYDVEEIFKQAKQENLEVISITDHNCARANAAAERFARLYDIQYIPGVELDAQYKGAHVRVLGYYIDWTHDIFNELERESLKREKDMSIERVRRFEQYTGISIDLDSLMQKSRFQTISPDDITQMMFNNERVRQLPFVAKYISAANSEKEAMAYFKRDIFGKEGPCYIQGKYPSLENVVHSIHQAQGIAILSGWHLDSMNDALIEEMTCSGLDGIEVFSPLVQEDTMASLLKIAKENKMFISCGSDYQGPNKPNRHLGITHCPSKALPLIRILTKSKQTKSTR